MKKLLSWDSLLISQAELDKILEFSFFDNLALEMTNLLILRHNQNKLSLLLSEAVIGFLSILFFLPINLLIFQKWLLSSDQVKGFISILILSLVLSLSILLGLNIGLWKQAKKLKSIAIISNKISGYNSLIKNFQVLDRFKNLSTIVTEESNQSSSEIIAALQTTKDSLLNSLELEKFILYNQQLNSQTRYQLLSNLEEDLVQFMSLSNQHCETEYQQLLTEAINLGLSVHQEVRKNATLSA